MLTKSIWWLTKSSVGTRRLGDWAVEDYGDTCRDHGGIMISFSRVLWWFGPQNHRQTIFGFGHANF